MASTKTDTADHLFAEQGLNRPSDCKARSPRPHWLEDAKQVYM